MQYIKDAPSPQNRDKEYKVKEKKTLIFLEVGEEGWEQINTHYMYLVSYIQILKNQWKEFPGV